MRRPAILTVASLLLAAAPAHAQFSSPGLPASCAGLTPPLPCADPNGPAVPQAFCVDDDNLSGLEDGTPAHPFRQINDAIDQAFARNGLLATSAAADPNLDPNGRFILRIEVLPGLYEENILLSSGFCLLGSGPAATTLRPASPGTVLTIAPASDQTAVDGFTITGGSALFGAGVLVQGGVPVISNNTIEGNEARRLGTFPGRGAGLGLGGAPLVEGNVIRRNTSIGGSGGGIAIASGSPTIARNSIEGNRALASADSYFGYGGGIAVESGAQQPVIMNNTITGNVAQGGGGGIDVYRSSPTIVNNVFSGNVAEGVGLLPGDGAAINVLGDRNDPSLVSPSILNNVFEGNRAAGAGGGLSFVRARRAVVSNLFHDNRPDDAGRQRSPVGIDGNLAEDPVFLGGSFRPDAGSPLIDAGSDGVLLEEAGPDGSLPDPEDNLFRRLVLLPALDLDGRPRPLDGKGGGEAFFDIGVYEALASGATDEDLDGDGILTDADMDPNTVDPCPPNPNSPCDDNCPRASNPFQDDDDLDGIGNACEICRSADICVAQPALCDIDGDPNTITPAERIEANQADFDSDGVADACDLDIDNDAVLEEGDGDPNSLARCGHRKLEACDDNCPDVTNATQRDRDRDQVGDLCDNCPTKRNGECDLDPKLCDVNRNGTTTGDEILLGKQRDTDGDRFGDACDNCPTRRNGSCSIDPDTCDVNEDGTVTNEEILLGNQAGRDGDRLGDACDGDLDNDGIPNPVPPLPHAQRLALDPMAPLDDPCFGGATSGCEDNCRFRKNPKQADRDSDGVGDGCDNCRDTVNGICAANEAFCDIDGDGTATPEERSKGEQADSDFDGMGDACDADNDNDLIRDDGDMNGIVNPDDPNVTRDPNTVCPTDDPNAATTDCDDNCVSVPNGSQTDTDGDGFGDACDPDADGDGVAQDGDGDLVPGLTRCAGGVSTGCDDNCPVDPNPLQEDADGDGFGDACDRCPSIADSFQRDADGDEIGDGCDDDADGDMVPEDFDGDPNTSSPCLPDPNGTFADCDDNCPGRSNAGQEDRDADGIGDFCDVCPDDPDPLQLDGDEDGFGNACDIDKDQDGVAEDGDRSGVEGDRPCKGQAQQSRCDDNCPAVVNPSQRDADLDGEGDACDPDIDGDGVPEDFDGDPNTPPAPCLPDPNGLFASCDDNCPGRKNLAQEDSDGDGTGDACDTCPALAGAAQTDTDGDGVGDECDNCPGVRNPGQANDDGLAEGDACERPPLSLDVDLRGGSDPVAVPGRAVRFAVTAQNRSGTGVTLDLRISLYEPGESRRPLATFNEMPCFPDTTGEASRIRTTLDVFAAGETQLRLRMKVPGDGDPGTWLLLVEACPPSSSAFDPLTAALAIAVK